MDELADFLFSAVFTVGIERAEALDDLGVFKMETDDVVIVAAALNGRPMVTLIDPSGSLSANSPSVLSVLRSSSGLMMTDSVWHESPSLAVRLVLFQYVRAER